MPNIYGTVDEVWSYRTASELVTPSYHRYDSAMTQDTSAYDHSLRVLAVLTATVGPRGTLSRVVFAIYGSPSTCGDARLCRGTNGCASIS